MTEKVTCNWYMSGYANEMGETDLQITVSKPNLPSTFNTIYIPYCLHVLSFTSFY